MKKTINTAFNTVTFTFDGYRDKNGEIVDAKLAPITVHATKLSDDNRTYATLHGLAARIGDNAAIAKSAENNFTVTEAMRRAEVEAMATFYENPDNRDWNMRVAGPRKVAQVPVFLELAQRLGCTYDEAMAKVAAMDIDKLAAM